MVEVFKKNGVPEEQGEKLESTTLSPALLSRGGPGRTPPHTPPGLSPARGLRAPS